MPKLLRPTFDSLPQETSRGDKFYWMQQKDIEGRNRIRNRVYAQRASSIGNLTVKEAAEVSGIVQTLSASAEGNLSVVANTVHGDVSGQKASTIGTVDVLKNPTFGDVTARLAESTGSIAVKLNTLSGSVTARVAQTDGLISPEGNNIRGVITSLSAVTDGSLLVQRMDIHGNVLATVAITVGDLAVRPNTVHGDVLAQLAESTGLLRFPDTSISGDVLAELASVLGIITAAPNVYGDVVANIANVLGSLDINKNYSLGGDVDGLNAVISGMLNVSSGATEYDPLETHPDWTVIYNDMMGPSDLKWVSGDIISYNSHLASNAKSIAYTDIAFANGSASATFERFGANADLDCPLSIRMGTDGSFVGCRLRGSAIEIVQAIGTGNDQVMGSTAITDQVPVPVTIEGNGALITVTTPLHTFSRNVNVTSSGRIGYRRGRFDTSAEVKISRDYAGLEA